MSRREQQIMDIVYARGSVTSMDVLEAIQNPPSYSSVRALMRILVGKGLLNYRRVGFKYVFEPAVEVRMVRGSALARILSSFFDNSPAALVAALLDSRELELSAAELRDLKELITQKQNQRSLLSKSSKK